MKRVLIITYYWPPSGGAGVQRWLKFVKYLRQFSWEPVVYTPSNPENPVDDSSLQKDIPQNLTVLKLPIWEPYSLYKKFVGQKPEQKINTGFLSEHKKPKITEKISVWIRGNFFIPDARVPWVKPSVKFLKEYLNRNPVDVIISTGPPHSMHLIAMEIKKQMFIPWLADFRDPWTNIDFYKDLMLSKKSDKKHQSLEKEVLKFADKVVVIGETMGHEFEQMGNRKVELITNGFDDDDIGNAIVKTDEKFSMSHIGSLNKDRNPNLLWEVLKEISDENKSFKNDLLVKLVGKVDFSVMESLKKNILSENFLKIDYLNHDEVIKEQQRSQLLLLLVNNTPNAKGIVTGKLFEYLAVQRPILCIGLEDGDAAKIIKSTNSGVVINFEDRIKLKQAILKFYNDYKIGILKVASEGIEKYSRKNLTKSLAEQLNLLMQ